jgi:hypothetical protein
MSAHDRTLLANLAFADPDKKDPLHDLACQYVAQPSVVEAMGLKVRDCPVVALGGGILECPISKGEGKYKTTIGFLDARIPVGFRYQAFDSKCVRKEVFSDQEEAKKIWQSNDSISNGKMGLLDKDKYLRGPYDCGPKTIGDYPNYTWEVPIFEKFPTGIAVASLDWTLCVEVKIKPIGLGEVLRQINLYREYVGGVWILVTHFDMPSAMEEGLRAATIIPFRLGDGFTKFVEEQRASTKPGTAKTI